jgi:thiol-disulfide isomerase/thioredoxin|tara:strand:+ start:2294 stop:2878 length:585 start_codon:yes stop_codon:yes gene_type:complete
MKFTWIALGLVIVIGLITTVFVLTPSENIIPSIKNNQENTNNEEVTVGDPEPIKNDWRSIEFKDIKTQETITINQFDKPILLESFAVWCPTCTRQQKIIKDLHKETNSFISISLDTDPNEDESKVLDHINKNGFDWTYAISPKSLTTSLIKEFGNTVVNAPQAPVVLICPDKSARLLKNGVKSVTELKEEVNSC